MKWNWVSTVAAALVFLSPADRAVAGRGGFGGGFRGGMGGRGMGMGGMPGRGMGGMGGMPGRGMSGMGGMSGRGMSGMGGMSGRGMSGMGGMSGRGMGGMGEGSRGMGMQGRGGMGGRTPGNMTDDRAGNLRNNQFAGNRAGSYAGAGANVGNHPYAAGAAYGANHGNWYHGAWNGNYGAYGWGHYGGYGWGGWGLGMAGGMALGGMAGMGGWGYGSSLYNMGYSSYSNPYSATAPVDQTGGATTPAQGSSYDYSQPIDTTSPPPAQATGDDTMATFDESRTIFKAGGYDQALASCDKALQKMPNDTSLHEFRALILFALKRYDEAAGALYAVLSAGPGWDWTTLIGLYPDVDVYTAQLRALEAYCSEHPNSSSARFVLAYHYLAQGHHKTAVAQLEKVVKLQPSDTLSAKLIRIFSETDGGAPAPAPATDAKSYDIAGTWAASPASDTQITLSIQKDGPFNWKVVKKGKARTLEGKSSYGNGLLTLDVSERPPLVGKVTWSDASHFTFQVAGGGELDPGLRFAR
jgi:tetratricopeptide (TPR) repeat protein